MIENIQLALKHFPSWVVYVYVGEDVPESFIETLTSYSNVRVRKTGTNGQLNMFHRFFAIDEPDVDIMFSRDADSRIHWKDRWAIREFVRLPFLFHAIRDHPNHKAPIMGGMWGTRKLDFSMREMYNDFLAHPTLTRVDGYDQMFLMSRIYPLVKKSMLLHYSCGQMYPDEKGTQFPFIYDQNFHVGMREYGTTGDPPEPAKLERMFPFLRLDRYT